MMAELDGAVYTAAAEAVTSTVEALNHFDEIVVAENCSNDWDDLQDINPYG